MKNSDKSVKYLDQDKVTRYAQLKAQVKKLGDECEVLNEELKEGFEAGLRCPKKGPWLLVLDTSPKSTLSWKDEWVVLAKEIFGSKWKFRQKKLVAASREPQSRLMVSTNPDYKPAE